MFNWEAGEDAIREWVMSITGLVEENVLWENYTQPRPDGEFVSLKIEGPTQVGLDYVVTSTDLGKPAGQEIELKVVGTRNITVIVTCFGGLATTSSSSQSLASKVLTGIRLPSVNAALGVAGLSPHGTPSINNVPAIVGAQFEARAIVEHEFYLVDEISEQIGYIATVSGSGTLDNAGNDILVDFLVEI